MTLTYWGDLRSLDFVYCQALNAMHIRSQLSFHLQVRESTYTGEPLRKSQWLGIAPKVSTRLGVFLYLRREAELPSETQYYIDRQSTKPKEISLQADSVLVFMCMHINAKKQDLHYFSTETVTVRTCTHLFVVLCIQHVKPPLRIHYSQNPNSISDTLVFYDDMWQHCITLTSTQLSSLIRSLTVKHVTSGQQAQLIMYNYAC
jgi:hypothetical protein